MTKHTARLADRSILFVEDEETLRFPVSKMLQSRGWSVLEAASGSAAIDLIRRNEIQIAVILLDLTLPGIPSRAVFEEARLRRPDTKVIVTSAFAQSQVDNALAGLYSDAFIRKPYRFQELTVVLAAVLDSPARNGARPPAI